MTGVMNWSVFVTRRIPAEGLDVLRQAGAKIDLHDEETPVPRTDLLARIHGCDGVMVTGSDRCDAEFFAAAPKLTVVSCIAVGSTTSIPPEPSRPTSPSPNPRTF